jgi:phosphomannomutase
VFLKVLNAAKFLEPTVVNEQFKPDPDFPTTKFPNPEESGVMDLAIEYAKKIKADLVIANDPDADRCAVSVKDASGSWRILRGDEIGVALGAYLIEKGSVKNGAIANSLVSSALLGKIAASKNIRFSETLTGFKWISKVANLEYGYEEALGYCIDPKTVNDKDGISASILVAELANKLNDNGKTLEDYLLEIGNKFGFHITDQISIRVSEIGKSKELMDQILSNPPKEILGCNLESIENLSEQKDLNTPGIRLKYSGGIRVIIRPSGTEPKLKCYIEVVGASKSDSEKFISQVRQVLIKVLT